MSARPRNPKSPLVVLGVTGGVAAYKALELVRRLKEQGARVSVVMTDSAQRFVTPLSFESVSGARVYTGMWSVRTAVSDSDARQIEHIDLAQSADVLVVAPATANILGKVAGGIADDLLSTVVMASRAPVLFAPAVNDRMWTNPIVQGNVARLKALGYGFVGPETGPLACGTEGPGRLARVEAICEAIWDRLDSAKVLAGKRVVVTAGRTEEEIDPVRVVTNRSSGRMGFALAKAARRAGALVTLVAGETSGPAPSGIETVSVVSTEELLAALQKLLPEADVLFMAAAPSDFRPKVRSKAKRKEASLALELERTPDILTELGKTEHHAFLVGFSVETGNALVRARQKLRAKGLDLVVANPVETIDSESVAAQLVFKNVRARRLGRQSKDDFARRLMLEVAERLGS